MALGTASALALGGLSSLFGGIAGGTEDRSRRQLLLQPQGAFETRLRGIQGSLFDEIQGLLTAGPGAEAVTQATGAQRDLAERLRLLSETGGLPSQADITAGQQTAAQFFAPQQTALEQLFGRQETETSRLAARLGRPVSDPILRAKLAESQGQQQSLLSAQQGASAQQFALGLGQTRIAAATQRAGVLSGLSQQAFQNRFNVLGLGTNLAQQEREFRLRSAGEERTSGGGFGGVAQGILGGIGFAGNVVGGGARAGIFNFGQGQQQPQQLASGRGPAGFAGGGGAGGLAGIGRVAPRGAGVGVDIAQILGG